MKTGHIRLGHFALWAVALLLAACSPRASLDLYDGPVARVAPVLVANAQAPGTASSVETARAAQVHFTEYRVSIPPDREVGAYDPQGIRLDPARDFLVVGAQALGSGADFVAALDRQLAALPPEARDVTLYVHGFRARFDAAVLETAQLRQDYNLPGPMVLFAWPAGRSALQYAFARDSALFARGQLEEVLRLVASSKARSVNILAHSLGGFISLEALNRLQAEGDGRTLGRIGALVLAEPDIDIDVFQTQLTGLDLRRMPVVVVASRRDQVLQLSRIVTGEHPRAGDGTRAEALRRLGVIVVDATGCDDGTIGLGHRVLQRAPALVQMIGSGAFARAVANTPPGESVALSCGAVVHLPVR